MHARREERKDLKNRGLKDFLLSQLPTVSLVCLAVESIKISFSIKLVAIFHDFLINEKTYLRSPVIWMIP